MRFIVMFVTAVCVLFLIIQQIVTLSKYGHDAIDICHPYVGNRYPAVYVASYVGRKSEGVIQSINEYHPIP